jgi:hypothetical protein
MAVKFEKSEDWVKVPVDLKVYSASVGAFCRLCFYGPCPCQA